MAWSRYIIFLSNQLGQNNLFMSELCGEFRLLSAKATEILKDLYTSEWKFLLKILTLLPSELNFLMGSERNFCPFRLKCDQYHSAFAGIYISISQWDLTTSLKLNEITSNVQEKRDWIFHRCKYIPNPLAFRESEFSSISFADLNLLYYILFLLPSPL